MGVKENEAIAKAQSITWLGNQPSEEELETLTNTFDKSFDRMVYHFGKIMYTAEVATASMSSLLASILQSKN